MNTSDQNFSASETGTLTDAGGNDQLGYEVHRLDSGLGQGVDQVTLRCGRKKIVVLPTRGMGIWKSENAGVQFGWDSPVEGPVHPMWVPLAEPGGLGWLNGFDEMMVRCGLASNGAPEFDDLGKLQWPLHGCIANLPASHFHISIDDSAGRIAIQGVVNENRFHFRRLQLQTEIALQLDSDEISITDQVINLSQRPTSFQMLYHNNFGPPILGAGSQLFAPVKKLVPRNANAAAGLEHWHTYSAPDPNFEEQVYFMELTADDQGETVVLLADAERRRGVSIRYDAIALPCFAVWKNTVGLADGYVTGLEPATNFPNTRTFEEANGRVIPLAPGDRYEMSLNIGMLTDVPAVDQAIKKVEQLSQQEPAISAEPTSDWCE